MHFGFESFFLVFEVMRERALNRLVFNWTLVKIIEGVLGSFRCSQVRNSRNKFKFQGEMKTTLTNYPRPNSDPDDRHPQMKVRSA